MGVHGCPQRAVPTARGAHPASSLTHLVPYPPRPSQARIDLIFEKFDLDHSGQLERVELLPMMQQLSPDVLPDDEDLSFILAQVRDGRAVPVCMCACVPVCCVPVCLCTCAHANVQLFAHVGDDGDKFL